ncbi:hypothetical protein DFJ73DRAFT_760506 [Zopfochytrium polystomum]|nr:hypothetical protein DFJ73DRAFT_760506 [Zopfochytrium polystomum]
MNAYLGELTALSQDLRAKQADLAKINTAMENFMATVQSQSHSELRPVLRDPSSQAAGPQTPSLRRRDHGSTTVNHALPIHDDAVAEAIRQSQELPPDAVPSQQPQYQFNRRVSQIIRKPLTRAGTGRRHTLGPDEMAGFGPSSPPPLASSPLAASVGHVSLPRRRESVDAPTRAGRETVLSQNADTSDSDDENPAAASSFHRVENAAESHAPDSVRARSPSTGSAVVQSFIEREGYSGSRRPSYRQRSAEDVHPPQRIRTGSEARHSVVQAPESFPACVEESRELQSDSARGSAEDRLNAKQTRMFAKLFPGVKPESSFPDLAALGSNEDVNGSKLGTEPQGRQTRKESRLQELQRATWVQKGPSPRPAEKLKNPQNKKIQNHRIDQKTKKKGGASAGGGPATTADLSEPTEGRPGLGFIGHVRAFIIKLLYSPAFTEFGVTVGEDPKKSRLSISASTSDMQLEGFHPYSAPLVLWNFAMSLFYEAPIIASFENHSMSVTTASILATVLTGLDILLRLFTLKMKNNVLVTSIWECRIEYAKRGLLVDLTSALPFDIICASVVPYSETLVLLRLLTAGRMVGIFHTNPLWKAISKKVQLTLKVGVSFMSIFFLGSILLLFLHIHACTIFLFGKLTNYEGTSWDEIADDVLHHKDLAAQYIWALFAAVSNTFPVTGFRPSEPLEQAVTFISVLIGAVLYAALVGTISSFSFGLDSSGRKYKEKIDEVNEYMAYKHLNEDLKHKIRQYYELKYRGRYFDEETILNDMNDSLRQEIAVHSCRSLIVNVPLFRRDEQDGQDETFLARIAKSLRTVYFVKGDVIFEQGWVGHEMYFIISGSVSIVVNGKQVGELRDGAFFGEVALLGDVPRTASIFASSNTVLYLFARDDLKPILNDFPDMALRLQQTYEERMARVRAEAEAKKLAAEMAQKAAAEGGAATAGGGGGGEAEKEPAAGVAAGGGGAAGGGERRIQATAALTPAEADGRTLLRPPPMVQPPPTISLIRADPPATVVHIEPDS